MKIFASNHQNISEKTMTQGLVVSVLSILLCIVALCSATFAWFNDGMSSRGNTLTSGSFDLDIVVREQGGHELELDESNGTYSLTAGEYTVTLTITDTSTVKGYCGVALNGGAEQMTTPIYPPNGEHIGEHILTFTITTTTDHTVLKLTPKWGYPANNSLIPNGATLTLDTQGNAQITMTEIDITPETNTEIDTTPETNTETNTAIATTPETQIITQGNAQTTQGVA